MGHWAKVVFDGDNKNVGRVTQVIVAKESFFNDYVDNSPGKFIKTSYNTRGGKYYPPRANAPVKEPIRGNFAAKGFEYHKDIDAFLPPRPGPDWVRNDEKFRWDSPAAVQPESPVVVDVKEDNQEDNNQDEQ